MDEDIYDICDMDEGEVTCSGSTPPNIVDCSSSFGSGTQSGTGNSSSAQLDESSGSSSFAIGSNKNKNFQQGQLTPDLLRNTFTTTNNIPQDNNLDGIKQSIGGRNLPLTNNTLTSSANSSISQRRMPTTKQRSFTTSILVSPLADRKFHAILPTSADSRDSKNVSSFSKMNATSRSYQLLNSEGGDSEEGHNSRAQKNLLGRRNVNNGGPLEACKFGETSTEKQERMEFTEIEPEKRTLCSGEVVVDIKKVRY